MIIGTRSASSCRMFFIQYPPDLRIHEAGGSRVSPDHCPLPEGLPAKVTRHPGLRVIRHRRQIRRCFLRDFHFWQRIEREIFWAPLWGGWDDKIPPSKKDWPSPAWHFNKSVAAVASVFCLSAPDGTICRRIEHVENQGDAAPAIGP